MFRSFLIITYFLASVGCYSGEIAGLRSELDEIKKEVAGHSKGVIDR